VEVPTTMANAIRTGNFRANSLLVAHPFSIFNVPYIDATNMGSYNKTELDLLQSEGEGIPKEMVKKFTENKFKFPSVTYHLRHQFNNWYGVLQVCFGEGAIIAKEARAWMKHIDQYKSSYNACFKLDADFGAKVDFSVIVLSGKRLEILQKLFSSK
jgi:hypothetical protein